MHITSKSRRRVINKKIKRKTSDFSFSSDVVVIVYESTKSLFLSLNDIETSSRRFMHSNIDSQKITKLLRYEDFEREKSSSEFYAYIFLLHRLRRFSSLNMSSRRKTVSSKTDAKTFSKNLSIRTIQTRFVRCIKKEITAKTITNSSQKSRESSYSLFNFDELYTSTLKTFQ